MGLCGEGPLVRVEPGDLLYQHVTPENAPSIVDALAGGTAQAALGNLRHPFFGRQELVVLARSGRVDPERASRDVRRSRSMQDRAA
jgi:bidirectional [NiFe] hydrogenase diaphorase subunit